MSASPAVRDYNPSTGALSRTVTISGKCVRTPHSSRACQVVVCLRSLCSCVDESREGYSISTGSGRHLMAAALRVPQVGLCQQTTCSRCSSVQKDPQAVSDAAVVSERRSWTSGLSTPSSPTTPAPSGAPRRGKSIKMSKARVDTVTHDLTGAGTAFPAYVALLHLLRVFKCGRARH